MRLWKRMDDFVQLQKDIETQTAALKNTRKKLRPILKRLRAKMEEDGVEEQNIGGYTLRIVKKQRVTWAENTVREFLPDTDFTAYENMHAKEKKIFTIKKST